MSSFRFRLETLLRLRLADRDQRRAELAEARCDEDALLAQADKVAREHEGTQHLARRLAAPGPADVDRLIAVHRYELVLRSRGQQLAAQIEQVRQEVERRRQVLDEADRQVRVLEKLRERKRTAHQAREEKLAQGQLDEQAVMGYAGQEERRFETAGLRT
jgi:flagellar FliJ protein